MYLGLMKLRFPLLYFHSGLGMTSWSLETSPTAVTVHRQPAKIPSWALESFASSLLLCSFESQAIRLKPMRGRFRDHSIPNVWRDNKQGLVTMRLYAISTALMNFLLARLALVRRWSARTFSFVPDSLRVALVFVRYRTKTLI